MSELASILELISKKRDGIELTEKEIEDFVQHVNQKSAQESQIGAMLMAIFLKDLTVPEITSLTRAMVESGETLSWPPEWKGVMVDKHSTGGVGDKVSLVLAPALAACGMKVPMISGRGLEHTGGTLDKLESIPGFKVSMTKDEIRSILETVGCCIVGQTGDLCPVDRVTYGIRDVTCTVNHDGLITASIVSKKAAEDLNGLVLDVKFGNGAFKKTLEEARALAKLMVQTGKGLGVKTVALLTDMNSPLGNMIGNAHEVAESIYALHGNGPADLMDLTVQLGGHLLCAVGKAASNEDGAKMIKDVIRDGRALKRFCSMMVAQGVEQATAESLCNSETDLFTILPAAKSIVEVESLKSGSVQAIDAIECAKVAQKLGAGRSKAGERIDHAVGLELLVSIGDKVQKGSPWIKVSVNGNFQQELKDRLQNALTISDNDVPSNNSRVHGVVTG